MAISWERAVRHVGQFDIYSLCRQTKFMYGINDFVHTTHSSKISLSSSMYMHFSSFFLHLLRECHQVLFL